MPLPDPARSRVVLMGVASYDRGLAPLPAVQTNLEQIRSALCAPELWGLPVGNLTVLDDDALRGPLAVERAVDSLHAAAEAAEDALIFYYAGHGLLEEERNSLRLAVPDSIPTKPTYTALAYDDVRWAMNRSHALAKLVILDCCFSGLATSGPMAAHGTAEDPLGGMAVLTATEANTRTMIPPGSAMSAFTGELIGTVRHGIRNGPELLDVATLYTAVARRLIARGLEEPQFSSAGTGYSIALARNPGFGMSAGPGPVGVDTLGPLIAELVAVRDECRFVGAGPGPASTADLDAVIRRLQTAATPEVAAVSAAYAALAHLDARVGSAAPLDDATGLLVDEIHAAAEDAIRDCADHLPELAQDVGAALPPALGRPLLARAEAYAQRLASSVVARVYNQVVEQVRPRYTDLIATVSSLRADALPYRARHSAQEDGGGLPPLADLCPRTADDEIVRLLVGALAVAGRRRLSGRLRSLSPRATMASSLSEVLTDTDVRTRLSGFFAARVRQCLDESLAPLRASLAERSQERSQALRHRITAARTRIDRILNHDQPALIGSTGGPGRETADHKQIA